MSISSRLTGGSRIYDYYFSVWSQEIDEGKVGIHRWVVDEGKTKPTTAISYSTLVYRVRNDGIMEREILSSVGFNSPNGDPGQYIERYGRVDDSTVPR